MMKVPVFFNDDNDPCVTINGETYQLDLSDILDDNEKLIDPDAEDSVTTKAAARFASVPEVRHAFNVRSSDPRDPAYRAGLRRYVASHKRQAAENARA